MLHMWGYQPTLSTEYQESVVDFRYEDEEAVDVCEAMERMAQLFLSDSGKVEDVTDQDNAATDPA